MGGTRKWGAQYFLTFSCNTNMHSQTSQNRGQPKSLDQGVIQKFFWGGAKCLQSEHRTREARSNLSWGVWGGAL